ncbi:MAG: ABC transporter ATP-binding protein, partial [Candidatus Rokuibacteriota bacterium]
MSEPLLVAQEVEREYHMGPEAVRVLRGVSLSVNPGESVAIIGASGVGKSTLLHLLGTLDRPTAGRVLFDGADLSSWTDAALARLRRTEVGFVFQFYNLLGEMTALENAMLPALLQRASVPEARERAAAALHEV